MARDILNVWIRLDRIHCFDEGDGLGVAEPYLWPVFFKIDGATVSLTDSFTLSGTATVIGTFGHHGNLATTDVDEGDNVTIPESIGSWFTYLLPIPVAPAIAGFVEDVAGVVGVVGVLMEEDNVSDDGAVAGYNSLVASIQSGLDQVISTLGLTKQDITDEDIATIKNAVDSSVKRAIKNNQNFFENVWSGLNPDDQIGSEVFRFGHDTLAKGELINFDKRFTNEGDWQIFGHAIASVVCPANATFGDQAWMSSLRRFRDMQFAKHRGIAEWWGLAERNAASLAWLFATDRDLRQRVNKLAPEIARILEQPDEIITEHLVAEVQFILGAAVRTPSRKLRIDARRASALLNLVQGRSVNQAIVIASELRPIHDISKPSR